MAWVSIYFYLTGGKAGNREQGTGNREQGTGSRARLMEVGIDHMGAAQRVVLDK
jgi:hypothetical protein